MHRGKGVTSSHTAARRGQASSQVLAPAPRGQHMVDLAGFQLLGRAQERAGPALPYHTSHACFQDLHWSRDLAPTVLPGRDTFRPRPGPVYCHGPLVLSPCQQLEWPGWLSLQVPSHHPQEPGHAPVPTPMASRTYSEGSVVGCH